MQKLSVVIACKNEVAIISETIKSFAGLTDDILIYDNGSTDGTQNVVRSIGIRLAEGSWEGFGKTKNKSNEFAKHDWILSLDADEAIDEELKQNLYLNVGEIHDLASVKINGKELGVIWTQPHRINISSAIKKGKNLIEIALTNTWHNRLIGDHALPQDKRITQTTAPYRLEGNPLLPAGLLGPVTIEKEIK